jgi:hypothetical protein
MGAFSDTQRNTWLASITGSAWVKLHLGDPGVSGTSNPAVNTTRMQAAFLVPAAGVTSNNAGVTWVGVPATETYSHVSLWTQAVGGLLLGTDALPAPVPVTGGANFTIAIGALQLSIV